MLFPHASPRVFETNKHSFSSPHHNRSLFIFHIFILSFLTAYFHKGKPRPWWVFISYYFFFGHIMDFCHHQNSECASPLCLSLSVPHFLSISSSHSSMTIPTTSVISSLFSSPLLHSFDSFICVRGLFLLLTVRVDSSTTCVLCVLCILFHNFIVICLLYALWMDVGCSPFWCSLYYVCV